MMFCLQFHTNTHCFYVFLVVCLFQDAIDLLRIPMRGDGAGLCGGVSCPDALRLGLDPSAEKVGRLGRGNELLMATKILLGCPLGS